MIPRASHAVAIDDTLPLLRTTGRPAAPAKPDRRLTRLVGVLRGMPPQSLGPRRSLPVAASSFANSDVLEVF
jgi:hypothetical protein